MAGHNKAYKTSAHTALETLALSVKLQAKDKQGLVTSDLTNYIANACQYSGNRRTESIFSHLIQDFVI